jgi:hypothetical protein
MRGCERWRGLQFVCNYLASEVEVINSDCEVVRRRGDERE